MGALFCFMPELIPNTTIKANAGTIGAWLESRLHTEMTELADGVYGDGRLSREERKALSSALGKALDAMIKQIQKEAPALYERGLWDEPPVMANSAAISPDGVYEEEIDGQKYLIVPAVSIVEGVMNGALVLAEEFGRDVSMWDGQPVVIRHPTANGRFVSAYSADVPHYGFTRNSTIDGAKLKNEVCIAIGDDNTDELTAVLDVIATGDTLDLSWGWYRMPIQVNGEWEGVQYEEIATGIFPDHLAILPDESGACSVADGCGLPRNNNASGGKSTLLERFMNLFVNTKETFMNRQQMVAALVAQADYSEDMFNGATDGLVTHMFQALPSPGGKRPCEQPQVNQAQPASDDTAKVPASPVAPNSTAALEAQIAALAEQVGTLVANQQAAVEAQKADLVAMALGSEHNVLSEAALKGLPVADLESLIRSLQPTVFVGSGGIVGNAADGNFEDW